MGNEMQRSVKTFVEKLLVGLPQLGNFSARLARARGSPTDPYSSLPCQEMVGMNR